MLQEKGPMQAKGEGVKVVCRWEDSAMKKDRDPQYEQAICRSHNMERPYVCA